MELFKSAAAIIAAYCLGSISGAYVVGRLVKGIDMTTVGNGRIGASFSIQKLGLGWGLVVGVWDFLKGAAAIGLAFALSLSVADFVLVGLAAVAGHNWSIFLGFKGGRGAAASFGVLSSLALIPSLVTVAAVLPVFLATRRARSWIGIRRSTLMFGVSMLVVTIVIWAFLTSGILPLSLWPQKTSLLLAVLPLGLLIMNITKRPWHPAVDEFFSGIRAGRR